MTIQVTWTDRNGILHVNSFPSRPAAMTHLRNLHTSERKRSNAPGACPSATEDSRTERDAITRAIVALAFQ